AERFIRLAIELLGPDPWASPRWAFDLFVELHLVLYSRPDYAAADAVYAELAARATDPAALVAPTRVQMIALSNRTRYADALMLGGELLASLGIEVPFDDLVPAVESELARLDGHLRSGGLEQLTDEAPWSGAHEPTAALMNRMIPVAFFTQPLVAFWLSLRSANDWFDSGFLDDRLYPTACATLATIGMRGDYRAGHAIAQRALEVATASASASPTELARTHHVVGLFNAHWAHPLADDLFHARLAFDELSRAGEFEFACFSFFTSQAAVLDTCEHLDELRAEVDAAEAFADQLGNLHAQQSFVSYRQLLRALLGETATPGSFDDATFDEADHERAVAANPMAATFFHVHRALAAAVFDDPLRLARHADAAAELRPYITGFYPEALIVVLHSLALLARLRDGGDGGEAEHRRRLDEHRAWLAARAVEAPINFGHLHLLVDAETLEIDGRHADATARFAEAAELAAARRRPWHHAVTAERAGRFHLRRGDHDAARTWLATAADAYRRWAATAPAAALDAELS
ncbi:MAG TPA: hypothetical protein VK866_02185, partial [Acidimicrobiales bacterium]|nr:hypothetical protein [Acidimicrobiales bacterium]